MAKKRKPLAPEDKELWDKVRATTRPMHSGEPQGLSRPTKSTQAKTAKSAKSAPATAPIKPFAIGSKADAFATIPNRIEGRQTSPVDRRAMQQMRKGRLRPEARIDLHGMTQTQALPALTGFIMRALADDRRMVLVITGNGRDRDEAGPIPVRRGVLRHNVPGWLRAGPVAKQILDILPAHQSHGGEGAFYVYLRRRR